MAGSASGWQPDYSAPSAPMPTAVAQAKILPDGTPDWLGLGPVAYAPVVTGYSGPTPGRVQSEGGVVHKGGGGTLAQYDVGNVNGVANGILNMAANDPGSFASIQGALYKAGYYPATNGPRAGVYGPGDTTAIQKALTQYAALAPRMAKPMTFEQWLASQQNAPGATGSTAGGSGGGGGRGGGGGGGGGAAPQIILTDPATVKAGAQAAAQSVLGRDLTDDEISKFTSAFHAQESAAQSGNGLSNPNVQASATSSMKTNQAADYDAHQHTQYADMFLAMLGPGGNVGSKSGN